MDLCETLKNITKIFLLAKFKQGKNMVKWMTLIKIREKKSIVKY